MADKGAEQHAKKPTIAELEAMLEMDEECPIAILPNGEIRRVDDAQGDSDHPLKPLTMREDLGGEYGCSP